MPSVPARKPDPVVDRAVEEIARGARAHLAWLAENVPTLLRAGRTPDEEALAEALATGLPRLLKDRELVLADREDELVVARLDVPGSIFETLKRIDDREVSAAEILHSRGEVPGAGRLLEIQRYLFGPLERRGDGPDRGAAPLARLLERCRSHAGFFLDLQAPAAEPGEADVLFAVEDPPRRGFLTQVVEVFNALDLGVRSSSSRTVEAGGHTFFLSSFRVAHRQGEPLTKESPLFGRLRSQLYATQILAIDSPTYREFVVPRLMSGEDAALVSALIGFCHTSCAHAETDSYTLEDVIRAFHFHPDMSLRLVGLFKLRFDPDAADREERYRAELPRVEHEVAAYNTGHRRLDEFRRSLFETALAFIRRTLKTNFFVPEKHALAFRLDPAYLGDLDPRFTRDLPPERPFRVTYFHGRYGLGYHIGFSDIARGGWRTLMTRGRDDYVTVANHLFRENYVLAHTQHLKNKDIYEGGSKMVTVVRAPDGEAKASLDPLLHKVQRAFANAFLDVFVTQGGRASHPRVVDHYGADEPIELGPDESMHDEMIEAIAALSVKRGYLLGAGIMSSKRVGINHKHYGVTSTGVVTFAEIAMRERGVDIRKDPFSVKLTGGPNGDVAGNGLRLLLDRCPGVQIRLVVDGTAALVDPAGLDREELSRLVLRADAEAFDPARLSPGGFVLHRNARRTEGLRELFRRVEMTEGGPVERWVTLDEFHQEFDELVFSVRADLFIPAGGRPETVDEGNWRRFLAGDGSRTVDVIVEGANSFITPAARLHLQGAGVVVLRDASANKCGVISSSYEIIGNLLLDEEEFLAHKEAYVRDVLAILERRAADEANLIFRRHREEGGKRKYTEISDAISVEINGLKARLFAYFESRPDLWRKDPYRRALLAHLPRLVRESPELRTRVKRLPPKYRSAILAAEIATTIVYRGGFEPTFEEGLHAYASKMFA